MEGENQTPVAQAAAPKSGGSGKVILIIVAVLIVLGLGGAVVYARYFSKPGGLLSGIVPKALDPNCKYNDPDLCKFLNNWQTVSDMTMAIKSNFEGKTSESTFKIDGKTREEMVNKTAGKEDYHTISIDKTNYVLDYTDNKWWKYTPQDKEASAIKETDNLIDFNVAEDKSTYKKIGKEACGKLTCFKYQVVDPANTESTEYIYFDDKEYLLRKTRSEGKDGSVSEATVEYGDVSVSAPSPTKDGNPYSVDLNSAAATATASNSSSSSSLGTSSADTPSVSDTPADTSGDLPTDVVTPDTTAE